LRGKKVKGVFRFSPHTPKGHLKTTENPPKKPKSLRDKEMEGVFRFLGVFSTPPLPLCLYTPLTENPAGSLPNTSHPQTLPYLLRNTPKNLKQKHENIDRQGFESFRWVLG
jgi:hypothetical protein